MDYLRLKKAMYSQVRIVRRYHHQVLVVCVYHEVLVIDRSVEKQMTEKILHDSMNVFVVVYAKLLADLKDRIVRM
jgi:hypothetical protein